AKNLVHGAATRNAHETRIPKNLTFPAIGAPLAWPAARGVRVCVWRTATLISQVHRSSVFVMNTPAKPLDQRRQLNRAIVVAAPIVDENGRYLGVVALRGLLTLNPPGILSRLIGPNARASISSGSPPRWIDLATME